MSYPGDMCEIDNYYEIDSYPIFKSDFIDEHLYFQIEIRISNNKEYPYYLTWIEGIANKKENGPELFDPKISRISLYKPEYIIFPDFHYKMSEVCKKNI